MIHNLFSQGRSCNHGIQVIWSVGSINNYHHSFRWDLACMCLTFEENAMEVRSGQNWTRFSVCLLNYLRWLFILSCYIYIYIYILLPFVAPFFRYLPWIFGTSYKLFFFTMYGLFLAPFLNNFFRTVWIIFGYPPPIIFGYCQLNFWFRDALRDLDMFFPSLWKHGGIYANSNCTNSSKSNSRNRPNSVNSPHKWAILQQC